jgi:hypothetical protein
MNHRALGELPYEAFDWFLVRPDPARAFDIGASRYSIMNQPLPY